VVSRLARRQLGRRGHDLAGEVGDQVIVAETGADMSRFPTAGHLTSWAGLAPAMHKSAGRRTPAGSGHGNRRLSAMLVEAARSLGRMHGKNNLAAQHARLMKRRGRGRAEVQPRTRCERTALPRNPATVWSAQSRR
jgi:transposase